MNASPTTPARRPQSGGRRDEWIALGLAEQLRLITLAAYDQMIGLQLDRLSADGCITKAPSGGECAGKSPVDRAKQGIKRSQLTDAYGIPLVTDPAPANTRDHTLSPLTLDRLTDLAVAIGPLPPHPGLSLDAGYDSAMVYEDLHARGITPRSPNAVNRPRSRPTAGGSSSARIPG